MEASELMIGDLVYVPHNGNATHYGRITAILPSGAVEVDLNSDTVLCGSDSVEPIPITPKILEKNGFDSDTNMFGFCDYELWDDFILENRGDRFCISRRLGKNKSTYWVLTLHYVHEFQHALHLCKIDKTIEL